MNIKKSVIAFALTLAFIANPLLPYCEAFADTTNGTEPEISVATESSTTEATSETSDTSTPSETSGSTEAAETVAPTEPELPVARADSADTFISAVSDLSSSYRLVVDGTADISSLAGITGVTYDSSSIVTFDSEDNYNAAIAYFDANAISYSIDCEVSLCSDGTESTEPTEAVSTDARVKIALIDTGSNLANEAVSVIGDDTNDYNGHGTAMANYVLAQTDNAYILSVKAIGDNGKGSVTDEPFAVVFAAMGITFEESDYFIQSFRKTGAIDRTVMFVNLANDPAVERIATPRMALTCAEYLAFAKNMHVLVIMTDITNYADALREISAARKEVPGRRGYPGYMYTDLATMYERAGRQKGCTGSITMIPILTMPEDDKTHPIPDLTGYITEGQIILGRDLFRRGVTPPIDVMPSLSRLKDKGIGKGKTREDHAATMNQLFACYSRGKEAKELMTILGESALTEMDLIYARFADAFEKTYISQGNDTDRSITETLDLGWKLLTMFPRSELKRISDMMLDEYYDKYKEAK